MDTPCQQLKLSRIYLSMHLIIMISDHVLDFVRDGLCGLETHLLILGVGLRQASQTIQTINRESQPFNILPTTDIQQAISSILFCSVWVLTGVTLIA